MLILMRRCEESIIIGSDIEVKVLKIQGHQVHLGIDAPRDVPVYRNEIWAQVLKENRKAMETQKEVGTSDIASFQKLMDDDS
jgi:carbon storage regulator